jgi:alcohol dehydrogenase class IV
MDGIVEQAIGRTFQLLPMDKVTSGAGCIAQLGATLAAYDIRRALVITGTTLAKQTGLLDRVVHAADGRIAGVFHETRQHVPRAAVLAAAAHARAIGADAIISFGGGSPNDTAKAVLFALADDVRDDAGFEAKRIKFAYPTTVEVPSIDGACLPLIAIPTTLSASEYTDFVGVTDETRHIKDLYLDPKLTAKAVLLDPELTLATPPWLWLSSGMRAVDHCIEALCSTTAHPFTDALAAHALRMLARFLRQTRADPDNLVAREQAQIASWMSVCGLANVTLGLSHGIGHQLGARCNVPHGHTSCVMLPATMRFNARHTALRQAWVAELMGIDTAGMRVEQAAAAAADAVLQLVRDLDQPATLREVGVGPEAFDAIAEDALQDLIVASNPRPVTAPSDVVALLESAY